ncbi:YHS domain-containing protein [Corallococcus sp. AB011P]|uniref:YHS domain-containing protein n=1 Tax=unclassified Corallococcus TaxID=2685029 RepID=UPI000EA10856|nr:MULTISPECIES: YHS domain-containing protein [unclassified Corallococcus]RKG57452.1 YHS domain-containing protein [Corallococcus sp. AB011P]RKH83534.1 YHS domain-containing protein [Corallococcus sp. AB045]
MNGEQEHGQGSSRHWDPVCGRHLEAPEGHPSSEYKKRRYFFCSEGCRTAFERQAERFRLNELARAGALMSPGRVRWGLA